MWLPITPPSLYREEVSLDMPVKECLPQFVGWLCGMNLMWNSGGVKISNSLRRGRRTRKRFAHWWRCCIVQLIHCECWDMSHGHLDIDYVWIKTMNIEVIKINSQYLHILSQWTVPNVKHLNIYFLKDNRSIYELYSCGNGVQAHRRNVYKYSKLRNL